MHFCLGCINEHQKTNWKKDLLVLAMSLIIVILTPYIISLFNQNSLAKIKENSPYSKYAKQTDYSIAKITEENTVNEEQKDFANATYTNQVIKLEITTGYQRGKTIDSKTATDSTDKKLKYQKGEYVVLRSDLGSDNVMYNNIVDKFRVTNILWLCLGFVILVFLLAGTKGLSSLLGLVFSILVIVELLIPQVISGGDVVGITVVASFVICLFTFYAGHGFNRRTSIALLGTLVTIVITTLIAIWAVDFTFLSGYGTDNAFELKTSGLSNNINLRGLLLSSMIIGSVGILDDITTAQGMAIEEISRANPNLTKSQLFWRGLNIGREHVISLVNTLAIAYIGSSMPVFIMFTTLSTSPFWVLINNQSISEEIVRSIVGSVCLLLAIPFSTFLSAWFFKRPKLDLKPKQFEFSKEVNKNK
jgi:uncharacterized membrane protein